MKITLSTGHALLSIHMHFEAHSTPPEQGCHVKVIVLGHSRLELEIKGFGMVPEELREFELNRRVMVVPNIKQLSGGHRFIFTDLGGGKTRIDHELEMTPKGIFRLLMPIMWYTGKRNLHVTVGALKPYLEAAREA